jgi:Flp pilus assembly protein protease CpaA
MAGCLLLALPYILLFVFAGGGAGDAKLMGAVGAWLGLLNSAVVLLSVALAGAVLAVGFALAKKRLGLMLANLVRMISVMSLFVFARGRLHDRCDLLPKSNEMVAIPYGLAIFGGVCIAALGVFLWRAQYL